MKKNPTDENLNEEITDGASHDVNGKGQVVPTPVETGDPHANRAADRTDLTDAETAEVRGAKVPRAQMLVAIFQQLVGMDGEDLSQVFSTIAANTDATLPGVAASAVGGTAAANLATIATKEEVEILFAGEELTEEFKDKATTLFEAAVQARVTAERALINEQAEERIEQVVAEMTEKLVGDVDRYASFAAEQVVEATKAQLEVAQRNTISEAFVASVLALVEQYKIDGDTEVKSAVEGLEAKLAEAATEKADLEAKLNESVNREVTLTEELKTFQKASILEDVASSLTAMQRGRFKTLAEAIECDTQENYRARLNVIKESVVAAAAAPAAAALAPLNESSDGVPALTDKPASTTDPVMKSVLGALTRRTH